MIQIDTSRSQARADAPPGPDAPDRPPVTVQYTLTPEEVTEYFRHLHASRRTLRLTMTAVAATVAGLLMWAGLARMGAPLGTAEHAIGVFLLLAGPICLWALWHGRRSLPVQIVRQMIRRQRAGDLFDPIRATFSPDGLLIEATRTQTRWRWNAFRRIEHQGQLTYLYLSDLQAVIIPDRAFDDDGARQAVIDAADAWRQAAPAYERTCPECGYDLRFSHARGCPECGWQMEENPPVPAA